MDRDVYNKIHADFSDNLLNIGKANEESSPSVDRVKNIVQRPPKRILIPCDAEMLDWHMRANCDSYENKRGMRRKALGDKIVGRRTRRISRAQNRHSVLDLQTGEKETEQNVSTKPKKSEMLHSSSDT